MQNIDTSWNKVSKWYKNIPKQKSSYHQEIVIPGIRKLLKRHLIEKSEILDLACGEASITKALADDGFVMTGIDLAASLIDHAKALYPKINFFHEDALNPSKQFSEAHLAKFDAVISTLAIQNMADLNLAFANVAKFLKPQGLFIFVLNHPSFRIPKNTSWGYLGNSKQYRIVEKYLSEQRSTIIMHPGKQNSEVTYSFHRPLQSYMKSMLKNNLAIIDLEEWISNKSSEPGLRAEAENTARKEIPLFLTIVAKKL